MLASVVNVRSGRTARGGLAVARALIHGNVVVSAGATCVAVTAALLAELPIEPLPLYVVFAAALFVYSLDRVAGLDEDEANVPDRAAFTRRYGRLLLAVGTALYLGAVVVSIAFGLPRAECTALPLVVALGYSVYRIKRVFLVKNLLVGACWGVIPLGVGVYYGAVAALEIVVFAGFEAAMLTVAAAVFDLKDLPGDRAAGIRTLPAVVGPQATRLLAGVATLLVGAAVAGLVIAGVVDRRFLVLEVQVCYVLGYAAAATPERSPLFYGGVIDAEHVVLAAATAFVDAVVA